MNLELALIGQTRSGDKNLCIPGLRGHLTSDNTVIRSLPHLWHGATPPNTPLQEAACLVTGTPRLLVWTHDVGQPLTGRPGGQFDTPRHRVTSAETLLVCDVTGRPVGTAVGVVGAAHRLTNTHTHTHDVEELLL